MVQHKVSPFSISRKHFAPEAKDEMLVMINYIKSAFEKILKDISWMDAKTKARAFTKLEAMNRFIAYPDAMADKDIVAEYHKGIVIDEDDYFGNKLRLGQWYSKFVYSRLREAVDKADWRDLGRRN
jgi:predicted metalloendopeptidase